jgi:hypothetical protein
MPDQPRSPAATAADARAPKPQDRPREVDGVFFDRAHLQRAVSALRAAGFDCASMTATLERRDDRGNRFAVTDLPPAGFTPADERQLRTLATSMAGALGALAAAGVTIATGGAAAAAVAAAVLVGGSAASGVHVFKTLRGFDGVAPEEDVILSVRVDGLEEEKRVVEIFEQHGAEQIWAQDRPS